jgi:hypothetical protein
MAHHSAASVASLALMLGAGCSQSIEPSAPTLPSDGGRDAGVETGIDRVDAGRDASASGGDGASQPPADAGSAQDSAVDAVVAPDGAWTDAGSDAKVLDPGSYVPAGYQLVWQDLFDTGTVPDPALWSLYDGPGNAGNGLRRPSAFSVHDGVLDVVAQQVNGQIVSGGMAARNSQTFGYFEFRVRADPDPSRATDAVVLTWPDDGVWPQHGENDVYETGTTANRDPFSTFIHYGSSATTQYYFDEPADGTQWHVMGMEWAADHIGIFRDGALVGTVSDVNAIPTVNHHVCIQLDAYRQTMTGSTHEYVDWVKVFKK